MRFLFLAVLFITILAYPAHALVTDTATLVRTIKTSNFIPPAPDPAGITFNPDTKTFFIADSEVDEMGIFQGKNVYEMALDGSLVSTGNTTSFTHEPTDISFNPITKHFFISSDDDKRVYELNPGNDGVIGTADDKLSFISTSAIGDSDTEGVGYGNNKLFITDGTGQRIFVVEPGPNGLFDGIPPKSDDVATSFSVGVYGVEDPEGVTYNKDTHTLFVIDYKRTNKIVTEVTTQGELIRKIDISQANSLHPAGIVFGPSSSNSNKNNMYIVDRGIDNDSTPTENDGKIYEFSIPQITPTIQPCQLIGDINCDNQVDYNDISTALHNYNRHSDATISTLDIVTIFTHI